MTIKFDTVKNVDLKTFKKDMQEAFQKGFEEVYGKTNGIILPEEDIDHSLNTKGAIAYKAVIDNTIVGGAIVVINKETNYNELHFLYVKNGVQSKGIGKQLWDSIEKSHPDTIIWETCTPYFEKRNVYFYLNKLNFYIVHYDRELNEEGFIGDNSEGMFIFKKFMKK